MPSPRPPRISRKLALFLVSISLTLIVVGAAAAGGVSMGRFALAYHAEQYGYGQGGTAAKVTFAPSANGASYALVNDAKVPQVPGCSGTDCLAGTSYGIKVTSVNGVLTPNQCNSTTDGPSCHNAGVLRGAGSISYTNSANNPSVNHGDFVVRARTDAGCSIDMRVTIWDAAHKTSETSGPLGVSNSSAYTLVHTGLLPLGDGSLNTDVITHAGSSQCPLYVDWAGYKRM
jgi:hypothetical protein